MVFLVKVRVNVGTLTQFTSALQRGALDTTRVKGHTWCLKTEPAVGYSIWETPDKQDFETRFGPWRQYYSEVEVSEVVTPKAAMETLFGQLH